MKIAFPVLLISILLVTIPINNGVNAAETDLTYMYPQNDLMDEANRENLAEEILENLELGYQINGSWKLVNETFSGFYGFTVYQYNFTDDNKLILRYMEM